MRDADRLKEKTEIALDDRQIAGLAVAGLLLLGAVFALGLLVGKHLAAQVQPAQVAAVDIAVPEPAPPAAPKQAAVTVPPPPKPVTIAAAAPPSPPPPVMLT